jgi:uncharacterized cupredoxin-like copper-binding protein
MRRLAFLALLVVALAGCGGSSGGSKTQAAGSGSGGGQTIQVKETEFSLAPKTIKIAQTGKVSFDAVNNGSIDHALEIDGNGIEEKTGTISAGKSATLTVDLSKPGTYDLYCPIDSHRQMGMQAVVVVGGGSGGSGGGGTTTGGGTNKIPGY